MRWITFPLLQFKFKSCKRMENFGILLLHSAPPPTLQDLPPAVLSHQAGEKRSLSPLFVLAGVAVGVGSMPPKAGLADHGLLRFS